MGLFFYSESNTKSICKNLPALLVNFAVRMKIKIKRIKLNYKNCLKPKQVFADMEVVTK